MFIGSIDPGRVNLAFCIEEVNITPSFSKYQRFDNEGKITPEYTSYLNNLYKCGKTVLLKNVNVSTQRPSKRKSGFIVYCEEKREEMKKQFPELKSKEILERLRISWKKLNKKSKYPYILKRTKSRFDPKVFVNITTEFDKYREYWDKCEVILIEQQVSYGNKINLSAIKIGQHCFSYFSILYGNFKEIIEYPAYNKYQVLGAPKAEKDYLKKNWAPSVAKYIWTTRGDPTSLELLEKSKKKDDLSDVLIQCISYMVLRGN